MKKAAILGTGVVGQTLAGGFLKHGYALVMGTNNPGKNLEWKGFAGAPPEVTTYEKAAASADILVLAVKGTVAEDVIKAVAPHASGKTIIDATNPIGDAPPEKSVLKFFTTLDNSLMERLQKLAPQAHLVKAFSSVGNALMVNPQLPGGPPSMFICGNNDGAKKEVSAILDAFGWATEDMGAAEAARAIEPLCMLWCIPGFSRNEWSHAFKLLRK